MTSRLLISVLVVFSLWGCSTTPRIATSPAKSPAAPELGIPERAVLARQLTAKNDLAEALVQWKILRTIDPSNASPCRKSSMRKQSAILLQAWPTCVWELTTRRGCPS